MVSTRIRQFESPRFKSRSGQIAYFHGVKTKLSTYKGLVMFLVVRTNVKR